MKEFIDKLIERLEEKHIQLYGEELGKAVKLSEAISIVNSLAEEYKLFGNSEQVKVSEVPTGWIPCSERLPKDDSMYLVTVEYSSGKIEVNFGWFDRVGVSWYVGMHEFRTTNVHAWMPLPAPFKEGE